MKNRTKTPIGIVLFVSLLLSLLELTIFIIFKSGVVPFLKAEVVLILYSAFNRYLYVFEMVNDLSLAYVMSYVFYLVILIPERRKQKSINKYISIYLTKISYVLDEIIQVSTVFVNSGEKKLTNSPSTTLALRRDTGKYEFLTYKEHFIKFYKQFNDEYQNLSHYIVFVDDDLRDILYEVVTCDSLHLINDCIVTVNNNEFDMVFENNFNIDEIIVLNNRLKRLF